MCLAPTPDAAGLSRRAVTSWLEAFGADDSTIGDATLVVSELVTNGVVHAPASNIHLDARTGDAGIVISVTTRLPPLGALTGPSAEPDEHGRGLGIVSAIVDNVTISDERGHHRVLCVLPGA
ncbi:MAG: hypothetical protein NVS3B12_14240 [Acidimicrobiales bacterium]